MVRNRIRLQLSTRRRNAVLMSIGLATAMPGCVGDEDSGSSSFSRKDWAFSNQATNGTQGDASGRKKADLPTSAGNGGAGSKGYGSPTSAPSAPEELPPVAGAYVTDVRMTQGLIVDFLKNRKEVPASTVPVVAYRRSLWTVQVTSKGPWSARNLRGDLRITSANGAVRILTDANPTLGTGPTATNATFSFDVPGDALPAGASFDFTARGTPQASPGKPDESAVYPAGGGQKALGSSGRRSLLRLRIVPLRYDADGSKRLPDTSTSRIESLRQAFLAMFPVSDVDISVGTIVPHASPIGATMGLQRALETIASVRSADNAPDDVYYYGLVMPAPTLQAFCGTWCAAGLGFLATDGPSGAFERAAVGVGFNDAEAVSTILHEVGHNHGREHTPCGGAASPDPLYPVPGGRLDVEAFDMRTGKVHGPESATDLMGYCKNRWLSAYSYRAIFQRIQSVSTGASAASSNLVVPEAPPQRFQFVERLSDGTLRWGNGVQLTRAPGTRRVRAHLFDEAGKELETTEVRYSALSDDATVLGVMPAVHSAVARVEIEGWGTLGRAPTSVDEASQ